MKPLLLFFSLSFFISHVFCQADSFPKIINDTLYTSTGYRITVGQEIKLGTGTRDNGDFKYITVSHNSWLTAPSVRQASLRKSANNKNAVVKKIKQRGNSGEGYVYYIIIGREDIVNYECDVEHAIAAGEMIVPDKYKTKSTVQQPASVADELIKLKKLYDDSVLTKEEYEAQKTKLLNNQ